MPAELRRTAARIADDVLFPAALAVDRADRIPAAHLDRLARDGLYGVALADDPALAGDLVETLAGGCLATTFVWLQHHGPVRAAAHSHTPGVPEEWRDRLARGERRSGIGLAGIRGNPPGLRVRAVDGGYRLDGQVPWVTGWDMIDVVHVAGRDAGDVVHHFFVDACAGPTLTAEVLPLLAVRASRTVHLTCTDHFVPASRLTSTEPYATWAGTDAVGSALNGFLALGVAGRCLRLLADAGPLRAELDACREALRSAAGSGSGSVLAPARAAASHLALRAAATLMVQTGSRAVLVDNHAQRLYREAGFLLVFGSREAIRGTLLTMLPAPP